MSESESRTVSGYNSAQILAAISVALRAEDMPAVASLVRMLAVVDPSSAQTILDTLDLMNGADA